MSYNAIRRCIAVLQQEHRTGFVSGRADEMNWLTKRKMQQYNMEIVANPTMDLILRAQLDSMGDAQCTHHMDILTFNSDYMSSEMLLSLQLAIESKWRWQQQSIQFPPLFFLAAVYSQRVLTYNCLVSHTSVWIVELLLCVCMGAHVKVLRYTERCARTPHTENLPANVYSSLFTS